MISHGKDKELLKAQVRSLAAWVNNTLGSTLVSAENLIHKLSTGVILCKLAKCIQKKVDEASDFPDKLECHMHLKYWERAKKETFFARDNAEMFIRWCKSFGVRDAVLFESDGLVLQRQPRNVVLCLLELASLASKYGVLLPPPIQLTKQSAKIIQDEMSDCSDEDIYFTSSIPSPTKFQRVDSGCSSGLRSPSPISTYSKTSSPISSMKRSGIPLRKTDKNVFVTINTRYCNRLPESTSETRQFSSRTSSPVMRRSASLARTDTISSRMRTSCTLNRSSSSLASSKSLQEKIVKKFFDEHLSEREKISILDKRIMEVARQYHKEESKIRRLSEGRYSISGKNVHLRIVRGNNVVVRLGGGWDTLEHFLSNLDFDKAPCDICSRTRTYDGKKRVTCIKRTYPVATL
ncbi:growth arrest-specific protein 2 [Parasteatoda tepidariorum]|uniref:growth arrest-specific protein 2 n=1 Tax=Parasteatoda tepidariorum TaxID=114398 RepID=UPI00077FB01F|nr:GAS2-like protein 3 [Parasteatoda tepidariorum]